MTTTSSDPHSSREANGEEREAKRRDWLELTLGFSSASSDSSSSSTQQEQLELGLNLGFQNTKDLDDEKSMLYRNYHLPLSVFSPSSSSSPSFLSRTLFSASCPAAVVQNLASRNLVTDVQRNPRNGTKFCKQKANPGLWFRLRSIINTDGVVLPQVPKAYIRVKDENVTIYVVKAYLVRKLGLSNESEVEISCMGQKLLRFQTMKYARDEVWLPKLVGSLHPNATFHQNSPANTLPYLMCLDYQRCSFLIQETSEQGQGTM